MKKMKEATKLARKIQEMANSLEEMVDQKPPKIVIREINGGDVIKSLDAARAILYETQKEVRNLSSKVYELQASVEDIETHTYGLENLIEELEAILENEEAD